MFNRFLRRDRSSPPSSPSRHTRLDTKPTPPRHTIELKPIKFRLSSEFEQISFTTVCSDLQTVSIMDFSSEGSTTNATYLNPSSVTVPVSALQCTEAESTVQCGQTSLPSSSRRTPLAIIQEREKCLKNSHTMLFISRGAIECLRQIVSRWGKGFFGFKLLRFTSGLKNSLATKGIRRMLTSDRARKVKELSDRRRNRATKKRDCSWAMWIEESTDSWMLTEPTVSSFESLKSLNTSRGATYHSVHNHPLYQTHKEKKYSTTIYEWRTNGQSHLPRLVFQRPHFLILIWNA